MGKVISKLFNRLRIKNMSILQAFIFLTFITLIVTLAILTFEFAIFDYLLERIKAPYLKEYKIAPNVYTQIVSIEPTGIDAFIINNISNWQMITVCLTVAGTIIGEALLFYRLKLKKPLNILNKASEKIAENDLDFRVCYQSKDEMGRLCASFEKMRTSLEENNRRMWRSMEERKRLNAAFSHDMRTPLTVLRGYSDMLVKYLPMDKLPKEKIISTISMMSQHIYRLEKYVDSMNALQKLEDISVHTQMVSLRALLLQLKESATILTQRSGIKVSFSDNLMVDKICLDTQIIMQVFENLISNSIRFARQEIRIQCVMKGDILQIIVSDDGPGFTDEELHKATAPFYKGKSNTIEIHFGLGLYICKVLCEKHGGMLILNNNQGGGATVTVSFFCNTKNCSS